MPMTEGRPSLHYVLGGATSQPVLVFANSLGTDLRASTSALRLPCLAIAGEEDGSTPPDLVHGTAELIPGTRFELVASAGHLPCVEQPAATAALITSFLEERLSA